MNPLVTVVVPTCLRPAMLRDCLLALSNQKLSRSQFEVIVVDRANDRATALLTREIATQTGLSIRYVSQRSNRNTAGAFNRGWRLASSMFIAFTQDDCLPQPLWLTTALPLFHGGAQVIVGRVTYPLPRQPINASAGANLFCRRSLLEQLGGFDEWLDRKKNPAVHWLDKLVKAGVPITTCSEAVVVCPPHKLSWFSVLRLAITKFLLTLVISFSSDLNSTYERCKTSHQTPCLNRISGRRQQLHMVAFSERREKNAGQAHQLSRNATYRLCQSS
ncbi:glycosyltransferase family 2 protein [Fibrella aquatica]|uniref:glycosyltransferase family 2 protein n=1 Tax=Fibrella aquatica TaxID=3242487 RepID=UPI00351FAE0F